ncbi:MAG: hemolysin [Opitutales bacterium TMED158]|nr:MAG: hemolysin [Opitutales bacterium TMED158]
MPALKSETVLNARLENFIPPSPTSAYTVGIARNFDDVQAAQQLRFRVFNVELGEGLDASTSSGLDSDQFDAVCDHLLIRSANTDEVVGTYRLQTGRNASRNLGYYSELEFEFAPFESIRDRMVELGRACIAREHRNMVVLGLLWKGIAQYAKLYDARYLIGCSSYTSTDPAVGLAAYRSLARYQVESRFATRPKDGYVCQVAEPAAVDRVDSRDEKAPKLMRAYLTLGARLCGEPALDRAFKTIDFLTLLDLERLGPRAIRKFLG